MIKNKKKLVFLFKRKTCDEDEKNVFTSTKLENFMRIQELKKMKKKNSLKFLEFHIMNLKIL